MASATRSFSSILDDKRWAAVWQDREPCSRSLASLFLAMIQILPSPSCDALTLVILFVSPHRWGIGPTLSHGLDL